MYVCICKAITDTQIREAARSGANNIADLQRELGVGTGCGQCTDAASEVLSQSRGTAVIAGPTLYHPVLA